MVNRPTDVRVRAYNVGFGDCVLITFIYDNGDDRHMLIDCGSTKRSPDGPDTTEVADHIRSTLNGKPIDVAVVTHRHRDHVSGFGNNASASIFNDIQPRLLVRPWTDHPDVGDAAVSLDGIDPDSRRFALSLRTLEDIAEPLQRLSARIRSAHADELEDLLAMQVKNAKAVATLQHWSVLTDQTETQYCKAGDQIRLADYIPGVVARALGPPTIEQEPAIKTAGVDEDEFWLRSPVLASLPGREADIVLEAEAIRRVAEPHQLGAARELLNDLSEYGVERALQLVRTVDHSLNNTSVVILIEVGEHTMLFSGDAQIENWRYILRRARTEPKFRKKLADLSLYKIGHHGSRNATPRTFYRYITEQRSAGLPPITTLMSTLHGFHGKTAITAVPSSNLVVASRELGQYTTTEDVNGHVDLNATTAVRSEWTESSDGWAT